MSAQVVPRPQCVGRVGIPMGGRHKARIEAFSAAFLAAVIAVHGPLAREAQAQQREVLIGVAGREPANSTASDLGLKSAAPQLSREQEANRLLHDARDDLAAGNIVAARAQLDSLAHRFAGTLAADEARKIVARMLRSISESHSGSVTESAEPPNRRSGRWSGGAGGGYGGMAGATRVTEAQRLELDRSFHNAASDRIFFANGSADLGARGLDVLAAQVRWLGRHSQATVTIEAHADDVGSVAYNTALSRQRGEAVRHQLVSAGIAAERVRVTAYGRDSPIAPCPQEACSAQNRRVVTTITTPGGETPPPVRTGSAKPPRD
jgi:peptidoglycan-associated lipoprotein